MSTAPARSETAFADAVDRVRGGAALVDEARQLFGRLSGEEKLGLLDGDQEFWAGMNEMIRNGYNHRPIVMGAVERLGIPGLRFSDGPRGAVIGASTAFPVSMARGATWDLGLEERVGHAIGLEVRAQDANFFGGICVNLPRHPAWGRIQETYGEDPLHLGEFGAALYRGVRRNAMAAVKHFALNSMENARFTVDVRADEAALHEVYLPHFRRVVEEGVDAVMMAYNSVNGQWAGQNQSLIEGILRHTWGFSGITVSDFIFGLRDASLSLRAGLDVEEPFAQQRAEHLPADIDAGRASWHDVELAGLRILRTQLRFYASDLDPIPTKDVVFSGKHRALARTVASTAIVLLKNDDIDGSPMLPLTTSELTRVAVIGRLADLPNTGDHGSSDVRTPEVITPLAGLREALGDVCLNHVPDDDPTAAASAAQEADVAVVIVGYTAQDEGEYLAADVIANPALLALFPPIPDDVALPELDGPSIAMGTAAGGDRQSLRLRPIDVEIITATVAVNPRTVVVVITAGAVITEEWRAAVPAVLLGWYGGSEGGRALADVLLGRVDASGRLPYSIPTSEDHLPVFDRTATSITYDRWHGQRLLDRHGHVPAFPLGYGLSYTTFTLDGLELDTVSGSSFDAAVTVTNTGRRAGRHVIQLYGLAHAADFPARVLLGFAHTALEPGQTKVVTILGSTRPLRRWTGEGLVPASSIVTVEASAYSGDPDALTQSLTLS